MADEFTTQQAPPRDPVIAVRAVLATLPQVRRAWLFGSRARGDHMPRADADIAIEAPDASAAEWSAIVERIEEAETLVPLDITRLEDAGEEFRAKILATGRLIHERE